MADEPNGRFDWLREDMQSMRQEMREGFATLGKRLDSDDQRIRNLEGWKSGLTYLWAALALVVGPTIGVIINRWYGR
jgi:hypothetical protein